MIDLIQNGLTISSMALAVLAAVSWWWEKHRAIILDDLCHEYGTTVLGCIDTDGERIFITDPDVLALISFSFMDTVSKIGQDKKLRTYLVNLIKSTVLAKRR